MWMVEAVPEDFRWNWTRLLLALVVKVNGAFCCKRAGCLTPLEALMLKVGRTLLYISDA